MHNGEVVRNMSLTIKEIGIKPDQTILIIIIQKSEEDKAREADEEGIFWTLVNIFRDKASSSEKPK